MAIPIPKRDELMTVEAFDEWVLQPQNSDSLFEYINGEISEEPSNPRVSNIAGWIQTAINIYLMENDIGQTTGEAGGYMISGGRYAPDVAYISYERQPELVSKGYNPNPPELAVEVLSDPSSAAEQRKLRFKLIGYMMADVTVWVVNPDTRIVEVYRPGEVGLEVDENGTLTADMLPGFELPVKNIFRGKKSENTPAD